MSGLHMCLEKPKSICSGRSSDQQTVEREHRQRDHDTSFLRIGDASSCSENANLHLLSFISAPVKTETNCEQPDQRMSDHNKQCCDGQELHDNAYRDRSNRGSDGEHFVSTEGHSVGSGMEERMGTGKNGKGGSWDKVKFRIRLRGI